jgi:hypothetical protein
MKTVPPKALATTCCNTNIAVARILGAAATRPILSEFSFYGCCAHRSPLMGIFLTYVSYLKK